MDAATTLRDFARPQLVSIAHRSGRILYSAAGTLRHGPIYLLGLNPGGDPATQRDTVGDSLTDLPNRRDNAFLDESWQGQPIGRAPLQRRIQWLLTRLGHDVREVCASNLIFIRSRDADGSGYPHTGRLCWPVHEAILDMVRPRLILTFGNSAISPFRFLLEHFCVHRIDNHPSGHGDWQCFGFTMRNGTKVIGLPHLSRYAIDRHPEVSDWVREY